MVILTLELIGVFMTTSRFPQYLMTAMLLGAQWVAETGGYEAAISILGNPYQE